MPRLTTLFAALALTALPLSAGAQVTAGPITNPANGHRYWVIQIANYVDYNIAAGNLGGYPVVINNAAENTWIFNNLMPLVPGTYDYAYIGLSDEIVEGEFKWLAGVTDRYTNWNTGEPNNQGNEDYAMMRRANGTWNDIVAPIVGGILPYAIVEANPVGSQPTGTMYGPICNPDNGHYYYALSIANFDGAEQFAQTTLGGHLATINDGRENEFIAHHMLMLPNMGSQVTIGLTDRAVEGTFRWVDGDPSGYRRFAPGEPNNGIGGNEDFAVMIATGGSTFGFWNDATDTPRASIVEVQGCAADFNHSGAVSVQDIFDFLAAYFAGCP